MSYEIVFRRTAKKMLERLPALIRERIRSALLMLRNDPVPAGSVKLRTAEGKYYRIRVGAYRIVYEVAREIRVVTVVRVGHRREVYRVF